MGSKDKGNREKKKPPKKQPKPAPAARNDYSRTTSNIGKPPTES